MAFTPGDGGGGSDLFVVSPQTLRDTAPTYSRAAQDVNTLQQTLNSASQLASGDLFLIMEFSRLASMLEELQARINAAMECAAVGMNRISTALVIASEEFLQTDEDASKTFTRIEDDTQPWNPPPISVPGVNPPIQNPGGTPSWKPQPQPQPWKPQPQPQEPPLLPVNPIDPVV